MIVIRPDTNHVAFIGDDVDEPVLLKKSAKWRIRLTLRHSRLDRKSHMIPIAKLETQDWVADEGGAPEIDE